MTKAAALHSFYSSFGLTAYEENSVPDDAEFPYITYNITTDSFGNYSTAMTFSLWYRSTSWKAINAKCDEISAAIGLGGQLIECDGGKIWIKRGQPFANSTGDADDELIKRKIINVSADYLTLN